ncbi:hypothetical protein [Natronoglycomyces albus]|uniref:Uncharacterized protein n=1 Tax=Natronoglycomyces albus TaxID=2811108 RepID=A0A895XL10_9ACTN|nr:hypothetical protein [Natronoglycomyces albus]QSB05757.1 hypothetical protein JQS30_02165 [Natronoglycomyces albus]
MTDAKTTPESVVEFDYASDTYMVSPDPDHGGALRLTMRGQTMPIAVATLLLRRGTILASQWETPFCGRPNTWREAILSQVRTHAAALLAQVSKP